MRALVILGLVALASGCFGAMRRPPQTLEEFCFKNPEAQMCKDFWRR